MVSYAVVCESCDIVLELNALDEKGEVIKKFDIKKCVVCGGKVVAITESEYEKMFEDDLRGRW